jgi:hypothetical protein
MRRWRRRTTSQPTPRSEGLSAPEPTDSGILLPMFLSLLSLAAAAEDCICPDEDPAEVYARMTSAMLARSGQSLTAELNPLVALKGELPERAYITDTWDACDLEAGPQGSMMLVLVNDNGLLTRCGGAGPLGRAMTGQRTTGESDLSAWLRLGGWSDEPLPLDVVSITLERELKDNPLEYPEDAVAVGSYPGLDLTLGRTPVRSAALRPEGPRWMVVDGLQLDDEFFYLRWTQEVTGNGDPWQWESHSIWQRTSAGIIPLWRVESRHIPVLEASTQPEVIAAVPSDSPPLLAAHASGGALALLVEDGLHAVTLDPTRGWSPPEVIASAAEEPVLASAGDRVQVAWHQGGTLHTRQYRPGVGWGKPIVVAEGIGDEPDVILAMSRGGAVLVSWKHADGVRWARILSSKSEWLDAAAVAPAGATSPHAAINQRERAALVWTQEGRIQASRYGRGGWEEPRSISQPDEVADVPQVGIDRWGRLLVAWRSEVGGQGISTHTELFARTWMPVRGWQPLAEPLLTSRRGEISPPVVVMDPMGESMVLWLERGARASIWARHHTLRRGWDAPQHAIGLGDAEARRPQVTSHGGGSVTAAWIGQDSAWTGQFMTGIGWGRISAVESADMPVHELSIASGENLTLYLWTQGDREPVQLLYREAP